MSEEQKSTDSMVAKMRTNTGRQNRKTGVKIFNQSRKKVPKNRQKKA